MHEMSIMQSVLDAAFSALEQSNESRITEIMLTVGEQTDIQEIPLNFAFEALKQGTVARNAKLKVNLLGTKSQCNDCDVDFEHDRFTMICPDCQSIDLKLITGKELRIDGLIADNEPFVELADGADPYEQIISDMRSDVRPADQVANNEMGKA